MHSDICSKFKSSTTLYWVFVKQKDFQLVKYICSGMYFTISCSDPVSMWVGGVSFTSLRIWHLWGSMIMYNAVTKLFPMRSNIICRLLRKYNIIVKIFILLIYNSAKYQCWNWKQYLFMNHLLFTYYSLYTCIQKVLRWKIIIYILFPFHGSLIIYYIYLMKFDEMKILISVQCKIY